MDDPLLNLIKAYGLASKWKEVFKEVGINTLEDLQKSLHTPKVQKELRLQAKEHEEEALRILCYTCTLQKTPENVPFKDESDVSEGVIADDSRALDFPQNNPEEKHILEKLGLTSYYPNRISLDAVTRNSLQKIDTSRDIPWYVLSKLFTLDYRGRNSITPSNIGKQERKTQSIKGNMSYEEEAENLFTELTGELSKSFDSALHPSDVMAAIFMCSSNFLRQVMCEKLFLCKLAIPLILPSFLKQGPMILLWPLRTVYIENFTDSENCPLLSALNLPVPVISCLRLGEVSRSKSKILNEILNGQSHPTFFHRDCENGMSKRSGSEGMVEIAWQLHMPRNNKLEANSNKVILNLRGNANECKVTTKFLLGASDVILVFIDFQHCKSNCISEFLEAVSVYNANCIIVVTRQPNVQFGSEEKREIRMFVETLQKMNFPREKLVFDFDGSRAKNIKVLKEEIEMKLELCLEGAIPKIVGNVFKEAATNLLISIDEDDPKCHKVRDKVYSLQKCIKDQNPGSLKTTNLPLQCRPWRKWAEWNKEQHRQKWKGENTVDSYADKVYREKKKLRNKQFHLLCQPTRIFDTFLNDLLSLSDLQRVYYLKWLKIYLDDLSRKILPEQQRKFNLMWNEVSRLDDSLEGGRCLDAHKEERKKLQDKLNFLEEELAEASFGLEHFMREVAQTYETFIAAGTKAQARINKKVKTLPRIMAELMKRGFPLELMDGDAAHIPLDWVNAVLLNLKEIIGDKKIFVLSVLGIQSSGKSTLLNAMFGLQFAVAAGRCTRGVYAQLLPLPEEYKCNQYEYLLVVDTEGLRASELGTEKVQHDNEIATFVIGIGDMTLVNIKGENVSEIEDVLQIVIHALLKMKLVNKSLALQPSCFFIHQNVPAPDAAEKLKLGQLKFMETLNKVTEAAGKHEDAPEITRFRQLIEFDYSSNVFYFPDLWKGDPPLAPVNPGYSESISKVREMLLEDVMPRRGFKLGIQEFAVRLRDLWNGILDQNFVFNFRNSLEIEAYSSLECVLADLQWDLKNTAMKWLNTKRNFIANSESLVESMAHTFDSELRIHLQKTSDEVKMKLEKYFEGRYAVVLEQWRSRSFTKLEECCNEITQRTILSLKHEIRMRIVQLHSMRDVNKYKLLVMAEAKNLANKVKLEEPEKVEETDMRSYFREKWNRWMEKVDCAYYEEGDENIETKVIKVLYENFHEDHVLVREALVNVHYTSVNLIWQKVLKLVERSVSNSWLYSGWFSRIFAGDSQKDKVIKLIAMRVDDIQAYVANVGLNLMQDDLNCIVENANEVVNEVKKMGITIHYYDQFRLCLAICFYEYASNEYYRLNKLKKIATGKTEEQSKLDKIFEESLFSLFPSRKELVRKSLADMAVETSGFGVMDGDVVTEKQIASKSDIMLEADKKLREFNNAFDGYLNKTEVQSFKEEHAEEVVKMVKATAVINKHVKFSKRFMIRLAVHACYVALPVFHEKHKKYKDNLNPRLYLEKEYYETYYEIFRSSVSKISDEKALANILTERLSRAVQFSIDRDLHRELADDVRNNVSQVKLKSTLLKAILYRLLEEDDFEEFMLYLDKYDACLRKWVGHFIDEYIFSEGKNGSRYKEIVCSGVRIILSKICEDVAQTEAKISGEHVTPSDINLWIRNFHTEISNKIPIPVDDMLSLAEGYEILSLESFKQNLCDFIRNSQSKFEMLYGSHKHEHLEKVDGPNIYDIILEECIGCTERCPFCHTPCTLNSADHSKQGIKHTAKEHYSQACAKWRWEKNQKLVTENCTSSVASNASFRCNESNWQYHPYKSYQEIFPDWKIHGDISVEASPYWKWFLVKYESQLAERYKAKRPDIPESWQEITKDMARESVKC